jgi:hypothetical protein
MFLGAFFMIDFFNNALNRAKEGFNSVYEFETFFLDKFASAPLHREYFKLVAFASMTNKRFKEIVPCLTKPTTNDVEQAWKRLNEEKVVFIVQQLGRQFGLDLCSYGRVRPETLDMILCLSSDQQVVVFQIGNQVQVKVETNLVAASSPQSTPLPNSMPSGDKK